MQRACELAARARGNTSPNPAVGAVVVAEGRTVGEGYHHRAGEPHAEVHALREAGECARGATLYVSLEPCNHHGRTPPCSHAVADAGIARVVIGTADPNPKTNGAGIAYLRARGLDVDVIESGAAQAEIEQFARAIRSERPYLTLKMAGSLDGCVAARAGVAQWLTGAEARVFVRAQRVEHDAVLVGAGTIRIDDPLLTVRPPRHRLREYVRVVVCGPTGVDASRRVFAPEPGYAPTIVLAPEPGERRVDLGAALSGLHARGIRSVLCEGGPALATQMIAAGLVDRFHWLVAPRFLRGPNAVPMLARTDLAGALPGLRFDRVERLGDDTLLSGVFDRDV